MNFYCLDETAHSPASSVSQMSVGSDPSPAPSPSCPSPSSPHSPETSSYRYKNIYEERLEPLYPARTDTTLLRPMPKSTHRSEYDSVLQKKFDILVEQRNYQELEDLLRSSSHCININQYDSVGQTPLQSFCMSGDLNLVQLMVRYGADTQLSSRDGWSTLHYASYSGVQEVLLCVLRCCPRR
ncbi:notch-regulated ankyrin repeat-containing protein B [Eurytemora carolleeae]|uniref:notch-regulated ankyrin repeat-containing protein B n=1 Tax=Eurytemora carolleeae TaxID=1294199 RepID=UPI000C772FB6|nr:notch-regulated ankyrin repeat-containing protein B [Eurytemora carolleeae]|eukprot:XP_023321714.1 notch-regulated ankyrin repeat-containing protein B-like [Eurytemora affinis]